MNHGQGDLTRTIQLPTRNFPRVLITGVPDAGKTSVASGIGESIANAVTCEFGQIMAEIGQRRNLLSSYRDLPGLHLAVRAELQIAAAKDISTLNQPVVVAAHVVVQAPEGYVEGLPGRALSYLHLTGIIVITSDPQEIRNRRSRRGSDRRVESTEVVNSHQERVIRRASEIAQAYKIPIGSIANVDGKLSDVISDAIQLWVSFDIH